MTTPTQIDYNGIFEALRNFQKGDNRFKDIDYDASGINSIIKFLAANSSAAALNNYFSLNESFIGTSEILGNVQALVTPQSGYVPYGRKSATAICNVVVTPTDLSTAPNTLQLPTTMQSTGVGDGKTLTFSPKTVYEASLSDGKYTFTNVLMIEGQRIVNSFTQDGSGILEFEIPNSNIDISTLTVSVRNSSTDRTTETYERFTSAFQLGKEEKIFFLSMNRNGKYKIEFGNGSLSAALISGNIVYISSLVSNGIEGDGISSLVATSEVEGFSNISIEVTKQSFGGAEAESIETIQMKAKTAQGMEGTALANDEYELKLSELLPAFKVKVWGGEDSIPPRPGYVMFTTYPLLEESQQLEVKANLDKVSVGSILTSYATYQIYGVGVSIYYVSDGSLSNNSIIETSIKATVSKYSSEAADFGGTFSPRVLENLLEEIDNIERVYVSYTVESPIETSASSFTFNYHREIGVLTFLANFEGDSSFDKIKDTGNGFYKFKGDVEGEQVIVDVDYENGIFSLSGLDTSLVTCTGNSASPAGEDYYLQVEPYEFLEINLEGITS